MPLPGAILFDLDDTIITEGERPTILLEVAAELAEALAPFSPAEVADRLELAFGAFWANPASARAARLGARFGIRQAREAVIAETFAAMGVGGMPAIAGRFCDRFTELRAIGTRLFPGAREVVETLRDTGVRLALVTNGAADVQRDKLERFSLAPLFHHVQIEGEHGFGKPEERAYRHALEALDVAPADAWMVGDNLEWEVAAPQRLGIFAIWHDHRGRGLPEDSTVRPDRIITRLTELVEGA